jgi:tellurite resistance protein
MQDVPLALPSLGLPPIHGVMVLGLAVGLFFTVPLFTLIFSRLVFEPPMPGPLQPTLMILAAPFAVGFWPMWRRPDRSICSRNRFTC